MSIDAIRLSEDVWALGTSVASWNTGSFAERDLTKGRLLGGGTHS